ncbi:sortase domain-containing protein [Vagococcus sp. JNUCC 83]
MTTKNTQHDATNSGVKKKNNKKKSTNEISVKVIKDGKVMIKKRKRHSSHQHTIKGSTTKSHKKSTAKKITHKEIREQANKKMRKRLSAAAILIGTLGISTTAIALSQNTNKDNISKPTQQIISKENTPSSTYFDSQTTEEISTKEEEPIKAEVDSQENIDSSIQQEPEEATANSTETVYQEQEESSVADEQVQESNYQEEQISQAQSAMTLNILGQLINYQNGGQSAGQSVIDTNSNSTASTWGGASVFSGSDGMNTHFIGHNPGAFSIIFSLSIGNQIIVTDGLGTAKTYVVNSIHQVYDDGTDINSGEDLFDSITGAGGGERITLQSCVNDDINLIIFASAQ